MAKSEMSSNQAQINRQQIWGKWLDEMPGQASQAKPGLDW
jgi:hypothetical protein